MVEEDVYCIYVLQQMTAMKNAIDELLVLFKKMNK
ncbi:MAG: metal-sensitive transcriptional regulator [Candidatus Magasanikbacteria bacterium]|nr:metal-sensitive transcriptional regulator [Candidatus Magasanikbacteria bacterium]NCS71956.1 metal-sensitive transcriptional regulator [Candidatus Magasanikbacteria bacterium]